MAHFVGSINYTWKEEAVSLLEVIFLACQKEHLREKHRNAGQKAPKQAWHRSVLREKLINKGRR